MTYSRWAADAEHREQLDGERQTRIQDDELRATARLAAHLRKSPRPVTPTPDREDQHMPTTPTQDDAVSAALTQMQNELGQPTISTTSTIGAPEQPKQDATLSRMQNTLGIRLSTPEK